MRIKICGITTPQDAREAAQAGADAIGLNLVGGPRRIKPQQAGTIVESLPAFVTPVALIRLEGGGIPRESLDVLDACRVSHLQIYGAWKPDMIAALRAQHFQPIGVLPVRHEAFAREAAALFAVAPPRRTAAVVLDAYDPDREGGTGRAFCWDWVISARDRHELEGWPEIVLAGGLRPENVADAIRTLRPMGVDVSTGVEFEGRPGQKDPARMRAFVMEARHAFLTRVVPTGASPDRQEGIS